MNENSTDWLGSNPVFYNTKSNQISTNISNVIDFSNVEFCPEGLRNYLEYGYSVFGKTPIKNVFYLPHSSQIKINSDKKIEITQFKDIAENWNGRITDEQKTIDLLFQSVNDWAKKINPSSYIIIPTSGGYDSRLLNLLIKDKSRIKAYSYGTSSDQSKSDEVVYAKKVTEILGIQWKQIYLTHYHSFISDWIKLYGISTHAHGMYHFEFFKKIFELEGEGHYLLSGIIGDLWSGKVKCKKINGPNDLIYLGLNHGIAADPTQCVLEKGKNEAKEIFWERNKIQLKDEFFRSIWIARFKMILLSYLLKVPEDIGFKSWSPFIIPEVALSMMTLPDNRRKHRVWQQELFKNYGLDVENMGLQKDSFNCLDYKMIYDDPLIPLNVTLLREVIRPQYVEWINSNLSRNKYEFMMLRNRLLRVPKVGGALRMLGIKDSKINAYHAYLTILPIQKTIEMRNSNVR